MKSWKLRGAAALLAGLPFAIQAQTAPKPSSPPPPPPPTDQEISEEIVVTAQKRPTALQDVPFSVAAVSAQDIKESGATNLVEIARNVPGLYIADLGPGQSQVAIRGISAGQVVRDQPGVKESVGIYLDESPISVALFTPDLDLYDLDRIEVLRGPQGTLFGAGSSSGTVRYITSQPKIGDLAGSAEIGFNGVTDGGWGGDVHGSINVPLGEKSAMRAVGYYTDMPGFIDSVYPGRKTEQDVNSGSRTGGRLSFRFEPNDNLSITPRVVYQKLETDGFPRIDVYNILGNPYTTTEPPVDPGQRGQVTQLREGLTDEFTLADLKLDFGLGDDIGITSVSTYIDRKVRVLRDASQLTGSVTKSLGGTDAEARLNSPLHDDTDLQVFSQEIRVASTGEGQFQWLAGAFYQNADRKYGQTLPTPGYDALTEELIGADSADFNAPPDTPFYSRLSYKLDQFAVFGEATYRFNPQWALTGGLRYYDYSEDRLLTFAGVFADQGYTDQPGSVSSSGTSPRVILAFSPNHNVQFTGQVSRGFRLGGINDPLNVGLCTAADLATYSGHPTWDDEKALNYEVGAKTRLADGRVTLNSAVFFTQVDGLQVVADAGSCSSRIIFNADAETKGAEMELFVRPDEHWDFGVSATYVDAKITQTITDSFGQPTAGIRDGNRLPTSPKLQAVASGGYSFPMGAALESYVRLTAQYVGDSYTQLADQEPNFGIITNAPNPPAGSAALINLGNVDGIPGGGIDPLTINFDPKLPSYEILNLRWGISQDTWEGTFYVSNLLDERAFLSVDRERGRRARVGYLTNPPRTYGVSFRMNF
jgi:iron complex outermembrane recepter protein